MLKKIFILSIFLTAHAFADEADDKAEFKKLYAEFNDLYANSEAIDPIIEVAEKLIEIAPKAYGKNHMNTAVAIYNLASLYSEKGTHYKFSHLSNQATELFKEYFRILDDNNTPIDRSYIKQYILYMKSLSFDEKGKSINKHAEKVRKFSKEVDYSILELAAIEYDLGLLLFKNTDFQQANRYFKQSNEYYLEALGPNHFKVGETYFWMAKLQMGKTQKKRAERFFLKAIDIFEKNPELGFELKQNTHAFLVALYEEMGQSDKATQHCQAVAEERPKDFDHFIKPLYRENPYFPDLSQREYSKLKKEKVEVLLEFDVDTNGFTQNVHIIESTNKKFNENSVEAAEKYRYAPAIQDGNLIETNRARVRIIWAAAQ